jgi:hypothetical protein
MPTPPIVDSASVTASRTHADADSTSADDMKPRILHGAPREAFARKISARTLAARDGIYLRR